MWEVGALFQAQATLVVPIYQRPYVWNEEDQWEPLWLDIKRLAEQVVASSPVKPHFLGAVVVDADPPSAGLTVGHFVVDGQQRLTTIQLFLEALADNYERICQEGHEHAKVYAGRARNITRNTNLCDEEMATREFKVLPMNLDQAPFRAVMNVGSPGHLEEVYADDPAVLDSQIAQAYSFFYGRISEWLAAQDDLSVAVKALAEVVERHLQIVVINLKNTVDPQLIFETLNARGTPLEAPDLIKNYLFHQAELEHADGAALYATHWEPFEQEHSYWSEKIGKGMNRRSRLDTFVHHFLTMKVRDDVQVRRLYREYRLYADATQASVIDQLAELSRYGQVYRSLDFLPHGSPEAVFIERLRSMDNSTLMPFVLELMGDSTVASKERVEIMRYLESYLVRRLVCNLTSKGYNRLFIELVRLADEGPITAERVRDTMLSWSDVTTVWPNDDWFRSGWMQNRAYTMLVQARTRMILAALEPVVRSVKSEEVVYSPDALSIEHLLPQTWQAHYPLPADGSVDEDERERLLHTFGNLTLVTKRLNSSVSNGPWSTNDDIAKDKGKRAEILRHAGLGLSRMLVDNPTWDDDAIKVRGKKLLKAALKVWPYPTAG